MDPVIVVREVNRGTHLLSSEGDSGIGGMEGGRRPTGIPPFWSARDGV